MPATVSSWRAMSESSTPLAGGAAEHSNYCFNELQRVSVGYTLSGIQVSH